MGANSPVTQKELAEVNKDLKEDLKEVYKMIGGLREEIDKQIKSLQSMDMDTAKVVGDHGVAIKNLEQYIKKVDKDNWL